MAFLEKLIGGSVAKPIEAIGNVLDNLFTSDDERLDKKIIMERLAQKPHIAQTEINKVEAAHRSVFVAGWRPAIGWVCAIGLAFMAIINPLLTWATNKPVPNVPEKMIFDLIIALLGLGGIRTIEKLKGRTK